MDRGGVFSARQSLARPLTEDERRLADAMEAIFAGKTHDFELVVQQLNDRAVARPSGASGPWTPSVLEDELRCINQSLDDAYDGRTSVRTDRR